MKHQLPLSFQAPENATFDNFFAGQNQQLVFSLKNDDEPLIFLWGDPGSGKSHLLQALAAQYQTRGKNAIYIPLQLDDDFTPELLDGLEFMELVCLDDIHNIVGNAAWEEAMFHFFNRIREHGGRLILAANNGALNLGIRLPDLRSRLSWGVTYQVQAAGDKEKIQVLKLRAHQRGFEISDEVANYLMKRATREMSDLMALLDKLDYASLVEQRKLTIPFIKNYL
ncbi:MAG: DnaA regulatory inactivator Hda [Gammaproteobacteria bacterium]|nr:DnaA regulatory inactivator Hda [Gammaproteobacteria bacterium]